MSHLRKIMLEELERRNYAETTKQCYIQTVEERARYLDMLGDHWLRHKPKAWLFP